MWIKCLITGCISFGQLLMRFIILYFNTPFCHLFAIFRFLSRSSLFPLFSAQFLFLLLHNFIFISFHLLIFDLFFIFPLRHFHCLLDLFLLFRWCFSLLFYFIYSSWRALKLILLWFSFIYYLCYRFPCLLCILIIFDLFSYLVTLHFFYCFWIPTGLFNELRQFFIVKILKLPVICYQLALLTVRSPISRLIETSSGLSRSSELHSFDVLFNSFRHYAFILKLLFSGLMSLKWWFIPHRIDKFLNKPIHTVISVNIVNLHALDIFLCINLIFNAHMFILLL